MDELGIEARRENLDAVLDFVAARLADCPPEIRNHLLIIADELFTNIVRHACLPASSGIMVRLAAEPPAVVLEFEDSGVEFNPLSVEPPDLASPPESRPLGGLGLFLARGLADDMDYRREGPKNIVTVRKNIP